MNNLVEIELAIKEGNLLWAYKELEFLYMQHNSYGINKKLTQVAVNLNKYEEAKTLIYDYLDDYLNVDQDILLVAKIYCENYAYLELALLLKKINLNEQVQSAIENEILRSKNKHKNIITKNKKSFKYLGIGNVLEQNLALDAGWHIPVEDFLVLAKHHLVDEDVQPLIRAAIIEILTKLDYQHITIKWLDNHIYNCNLQLEKVNHLEIENEISEKIQNMLNKDIQSQKILLEYLTIFSKIVFPYFSKVAPKPELFASALVKRLKGHNDDYITQNKWIEMVDNLLLTLNY